jgi:hypothetical protein
MPAQEMRARSPRQRASRLKVLESTIMPAVPPKREPATRQCERAGGSAGRVEPSSREAYPVVQSNQSLTHRMDPLTLWNALHLCDDLAVLRRIDRLSPPVAVLVRPPIRNQGNVPA